MDDDAQGQPLDVLWDRELDAQVITGEAWDAIAKRGFDPAGRFAAYGFLEFLTVHSVAFGGIHEYVVAARGGSLISRIQQADFQKQLAQIGLAVCADLLGQKFLLRRRVLFRLYLVPLRQAGTWL